jgi:hypothetical protein
MNAEGRRNQSAFILPSSAFIGVKFFASTPEKRPPHQRAILTNARKCAACALSDDSCTYIMCPAS